MDGCDAQLQADKKTKGRIDMDDGAGLIRLVKAMACGKTKLSIHIIGPADIGP